MLLPRVKTEHRPARDSRGRILIGSPVFGVASEIVDDDEGTIWRLLGLMDGTRSPEQVLTTFLEERPHVDRVSAADAVGTLIGSGFVEDAAGAIPGELSAAELDRYSRSTAFFSWVDTVPRSSPLEVQGRLKRATVAVLGVGGSGSALAMSLVAVGVGTIRCYDFDLVSSSNLNRQLLYDEEDVGAPKIERAVERLRKLNSHVRVNGEELEVRSARDLVPVMDGCGLLALCADLPAGEIQRWTNEAALETGTPWLLAMHGGPVVKIGTFVPDRTPCYACMAHCEERDALASWGSLDTPRPAVTAAIAPTSAIAGHIGALEAIYFLAGLRPQTVGRMLCQSLVVYDDQRFVAPDYWDDCPACGSNGTFTRTIRG